MGDSFNFFEIMYDGLRTDVKFDIDMAKRKAQFDIKEAKREIISKENSFKKDEYISSLEDFIELTCALCPNEEELIRHRGNELIKEISRL